MSVDSEGDDLGRTSTLCRLGSARLRSAPALLEHSQGRQGGAAAVPPAQNRRNEGVLSTRDVWIVWIVGLNELKSVSRILGQVSPKRILFRSVNLPGLPMSVSRWSHGAHNRDVVL